MGTRVLDRKEKPSDLSQEKRSAWLSASEALEASFRIKEERGREGTRRKEGSSEAQKTRATAKTVMYECPARQPQTEGSFVAWYLEGMESLTYF